LEAIVAKSVERAIIDKRYSGFFEGKPLTDKDVESLKMRMIVKEDLKDELKEAVEECWNTVLKKQKVGVDKFFIRLVKIYKK
jgi:hypothetical protein